MTVRRVKGVRFQVDSLWDQWRPCRGCAEHGRDVSVPLGRRDGATGEFVAFPPNEVIKCAECETPVDMNEPPRWALYFEKDLLPTGYYRHDAYERNSVIQSSIPILVLTRGEDNFWWFRDRFYSDDESLAAEEVAAITLDRERKRRVQIERAVARHQLPLVEESEGRRPPIPDDVKIFVWRRDDGQCVRCGSRENLEFDHIIPITMGGSHSARNLQLLCEPCNREKGGNLV